ncbi:MAG: phosphoribosylanthranilate isomerase [Candidatus Syntropharchaeia archaeon]
MIVVGDDPGEVLKITNFLKPDMVQLHGSESYPVTRKLISELKSRGVWVSKALRFSVETGELDYDIPDPIEASRKLEDAGIDALVLDSKTKSRPAGTGKPFDWEIARKLRESTYLPIILAGGLNAGNVRAAIETVRPYGVDVISSLEDSVGKKDPEKVRTFMRIVRSLEL